MTPWCDDLVCSWRRLLADRHSLPFPWTLSLHRRWCPSASHHPLTFLFLLALTFALPSPFPSLGLSLCRPQWGGGVYRAMDCDGPAASPHTPMSHALPPWPHARVHSPGASTALCPGPGGLSTQTPEDWRERPGPTPQTTSAAPPPPRCGMQMLNADLYAARHKAAEHRSQNKKLFSDIAMGAFR